MRISAPSFLHSQSLPGWALGILKLEENINFVIFEACLFPYNSPIVIRILPADGKYKILEDLFRGGSNKEAKSIG
jgi:hypothetical protein